MENKKKKFLELLGAFAGGALLVGLVVFSVNGASLQGRVPTLSDTLKSSANTGISVNPPGCALSACTVQTNLNGVLAALSDVQNKVKLLRADVDAVRTGDLPAIAGKFTDVYNRLDGLQSTLTWLGSYTTSRFTQTSNQLQALGQGGLD